MDSQIWSAKGMVAVGFLMLLLTSLQGWGMVGVVAFGSDGRTGLLHELKRLHNLGLSGGFLAIGCGLALIVLPFEAGRSSTICRVLFPSLLVAPVAFSDRISVILVGPIPFALQAGFYAFQAASALGITLALGLVVHSVFRRERRTRY